MRRLLLSSCALFLLALAVPAPAADTPAPAKLTWAQWRGPGRDGIVTAGPAWPASIKGEALKQVWRVGLGEGYPGPIVAEDRVFTAETTAGKEIVRALDRATGKQLWEHSWAGKMTVPFFAAANGSWVRSTPAYDGESLYVAGMRDVLVCIDAKTGKERWKADLMERYKTPLPAFGFVCSPLVEDGAVYVQAAASFLKLDAKTGKTIWRSLSDGGGMYGSAFSSPYSTTLAGQKQIVVQTRNELAGVEPASGKVLWQQKIPAMRGMNILTPTVYNGGVFTSAYGAKTYYFKPEKVEEKGYEVKAPWTLPGDANMSSPVVIGKHAYLLLKSQRFTCIDLETGKTRWTTKTPFGKYWSLVAKGDRILALDQRGILYHIRANPEKYEQLEEVRVSEQETWGHLAVVGDELFVRELKGMIKFRWK